MPSRPRPVAPLAVVTVVAVVAVLGVGVLGGCGRKDEFPDRRAQVTLRGRTTEYVLDSCGRDGTTVFLVGRAKDGSVLQAVLGLRRDRRTGVPGLTGVTITKDPDSVAAFGAASWARRGEAGPPPGRITSARLRGARVQIGAQVQPVDDQDQPTDDPLVELRVDGRCDQQS